MTEPQDNPIDSLSESDRRLIDRIDAAYTPVGLTPQRRAALEQDLWKRIGRRRAWLVPTLSTALAASLVLWLAWPGAWRSPGSKSAVVQTAKLAAGRAADEAGASGAGGEPGVAGVAGTAGRSEVDEWELLLLHAGEAPLAIGMSEDESLPDDYRVIAAALSDG